MKLLQILAGVAAILTAAEIRPQPGDWLRLEVGKTGLMRGKKHLFEFPAYQGQADPQKLAFELSIESAKVEVKDDWLKAGDLKKVTEFTVKEMLDSAKHPRMVYRSTKVERQGSELLAQGLLNIRGVEKAVEVKLRESGGVYEGSSTVDMRQFGLKPPTAALGAVGTDPLMKLSFRLTLR